MVTQGVDGRGNLRGDRYRNHVRRLKLHIPKRFKNPIVEPKPLIVNNAVTQLTTLRCHQSLAAQLEQAGRFDSQ